MEKGIPIRCFKFHPRGMSHANFKLDPIMEMGAAASAAGPDLKANNNNNYSLFLPDAPGVGYAHTRTHVKNPLSEKIGTILKAKKGDPKFYSPSELPTFFYKKKRHKEAFLRGASNNLWQ